MKYRFPGMAILFFSLSVTVPASPAPAPAGDVGQLIAKLSSISSRERKEATRALEKMGASALPALRTAAANSKDSEVRARISALARSIQLRQEADRLQVDLRERRLWKSSDGRLEIAAAEVRGADLKGIQLRCKDGREIATATAENGRVQVDLKAGLLILTLGPGESHSAGTSASWEKRTITLKLLDQ